MHHNSGNMSELAKSDVMTLVQASGSGQELVMSLRTSEPAKAKTVRSSEQILCQIEQGASENIEKAENVSLPRGIIRKSVRSIDATRYLFNSFRVLGVLMPQTHKLLYVLYSFILNFLVTVWLPLSFVFSYATMSQEYLDISSLLTSIQVAINVFGCSLKIVVMAFLLPKLYSAKKYMTLLDARCTNEGELNELRKLVKEGNRFVVYFAMSYWSYSTSTFLASVLFGQAPYSLYNPFFDWRGPKWEFWVASFIEFALMDVACFQQVVDDSYPVIYVSILRTHLKILLLRIQKLATNPELTLEQNLEELRLCIIDHKNLLGLYNGIAPIISVTIFIQFTITATLLGVTMLNMFIFTTKFSVQVASCFYVLAVVVEIFPLCFYAQCLMTESEHLAQTIFHCNWVDQDMRCRKMLVFFMQRTQRVMEFSAGKIFPITLASFLSIAKFSFSLYTFMKQMNLKERFGLE